MKSYIWQCITCIVSHEIFKMIQTAHQSVTMRQNTSIWSNKCENASPGRRNPITKQQMSKTRLWVKSLNKVSGFYQFSAASFTFGRAPNILSSTTKGNHFQKYKKVFTNKSIPMRKIPPTLGRKFQIKTEKLPLFRTNIAEIHSYAKPYTTKKQ